MASSSRRRGGDASSAPLGVYVKPGPDGLPLRRTAVTPSEAVALLFEGFQPDDGAAGEQGTAPTTT